MTHAVTARVAPEGLSETDAAGAAQVAAAVTTERAVRTWTELGGSDGGGGGGGVDDGGGGGVDDGGGIWWRRNDSLRVGGLVGWLATPSSTPAVHFTPTPNASLSHHPPEPPTRPPPTAGQVPQVVWQ